MTRHGKKILSSFLVVLLLILALPQMAFALTFGDFIYTTDGTSVTITGYTGTATDLTIPDTIDSKPVTKIDQYAFFRKTTLTSVTMLVNLTTIGDFAFLECSSLASVVIPGTVTAIGAGAFKSCTSLTSAAIPTGITSVSASLFYGCSKLASVTIPATVTAIGDLSFYGCSALPAIDLPAGLLTIGANAFQNCSSLTAMVIPTGVTAIASSTFSGCLKLASVTFPAGLISIGTSAFASCAKLAGVTLPAGLTALGTYAFAGCTSLTVMTIPSGVAVISESAFSGCSALASVVIPNGVTTIGISTFKDCTSLASITIPDSVIAIGNMAFSSCTSLTTMALPPNLTTISERTFDGCTNLTSVVLPANLESIGDYAFYPCMKLASITFPSTLKTIGTQAFGACYELTSVTIPNGVTTIGAQAFWKCSKLASVTIPNSVTSLGGAAFQDCTALTTVSIPTGITTIPDYLFTGCTSLTSMTIPAGITSIGLAAFWGCSSLATMTFLGISPTITMNSLPDPTVVTLYYDGSLTDARATRFTTPTWVTDWGTYNTNLIAQLTVTFKDWDGTVLKTEIVTPGGSATPPANPTRVGHAFAGWSGSYTNVSTSQIVTATYTPFTYTVRFLDWDATVLKSQTVNYGAAATPPANPTRVAFTFTGWSGSYTNVTADVDVTAQYTPSMYTVDFKDWDGTVLKSESVGYDGSATPPADPTRAGHTFTGWQGTYTHVTANQIVTAQYTIHTFTVQFFNWDATLLKSQTVDYDTAAAAPANPAREGYIFTGWDKAFTNVKENLDVTAQFEKAPDPAVSKIEPGATTLFVGDNQLQVTVTASNPLSGTQIMLQLVNSSHQPLSPDISTTSGLDGSGKALVTLTLPDDLIPGTYYLDAQIVGSENVSSTMITILAQPPVTGETARSWLAGLLLLGAAALLTIGRKHLGMAFQKLD